MSYYNVIDTVKQNVNWLKTDVNSYDYQIVRAGKQCFNLKKCQLYSTRHSPTANFPSLPVNSVSEKPFGLSSNFYVDFKIERIEFAVY